MEDLIETFRVLFAAIVGLALVIGILLITYTVVIRPISFSI